MLPAVQAAREAARRAQCANNLKQIGLSIHNYHDVNNTIPSGNLQANDSDNRYLTWLVLLLPYMEQNALYDKFDLSLPYDQSPNPAACAIPGISLSAYQCPSRGRSTSDQSDANPLVGPVGDYACVSLATTPGSAEYQHMFHGADRLAGSMISARREANQPEWKDRLKFAHVTDGLSNTAFIGEKHLHIDGLRKGGTHGDGNHFIIARTAWYETHSIRNMRSANGLGLGPQDIRSGHYHQFGSWHPTICQFVFGDGSVHAVSNNTSLDTLILLGHRADGQVIGDY
ncbi:MAG: DUF1559 domain-containing protein [bacterium]|nr:DUF1559 domain-containing protein [bacterium]